MAAVRDVVVVQGPGSGRAAFQTSFTSATQITPDQLGLITHPDMVVIDGIEALNTAWIPTLVGRLATHCPDVPVGIVVPLDAAQGNETPNDATTPADQLSLPVHITEVKPMDGAVMVVVEPGGIMSATTLADHLTLIAQTSAAVHASTRHDPSVIAESERRLLIHLAEATAQIDHLHQVGTGVTGQGRGTNAINRGVQIVQILRNRVARDGIETTARWLASRALAAAQGRPDATAEVVTGGETVAVALPPGPAATTVQAKTAAHTKRAPIEDIPPGTHGVLHRLSEALPATLSGVQLIIAQIPPDDVAAAITSMTATDAAGLHRRIVDHGWKIVTALRLRGAQAAARGVLEVLLPLTHGAATRRPLLVTEAHLDLLAHNVARGADRHAWTACLSPVVEQSNHALTAGDHAHAADLMTITLDVLLDSEQQDDITTPLVDDTQTWLEPLRSSEVLRLIQQPTGGQQRPTRRQDAQRHHVVVMVEHRSMTDPLLAALQNRPDVELYVVDRASIEAGGSCLRPSQLLVDQVIHRATGQLPDMSDDVRAWLDWADTIILDSPDPSAQWTTMVAGASPRILLRVHGIDMMRPTFQLVTWARVDELLVAGDDVRDLAVRAMPAETDHLGIHVLPDPVQLQQFTTRKTSAADRTIAVVDWGSRMADPVWALEVLARLRLSDPSWRLVLVGAGFGRQQTKSDRHYRHLFDETIQRLELRDCVEEVDDVDDLDEVLADVGFIMSSSRRGDFEVRVSEGAASGAVPVIRDWPMFHLSAGPRSWYPTGWVVDDVDAAAGRMLELADPRVRAIAGSRAREFVLHNHDWSIVQQAWLELVVGPTSD